MEPKSVVRGRIVPRMTDYGQRALPAPRPTNDNSGPRIALGSLLPRTVLQYALATTPATTGSGSARRWVLLAPPGARCFVDELPSILPLSCRKSKRAGGQGSGVGDRQSSILDP